MCQKLPGTFRRSPHTQLVPAWMTLAQKSVIKWTDSLHSVWCLKKRKVPGSFPQVGPQSIIKWTDGLHSVWCLRKVPGSFPQVGTHHILHSTHTWLYTCTITIMIKAGVDNGTTPAWWSFPRHHECRHLNPEMIIQMVHGWANHAAHNF